MKQILFLAFALSLSINSSAEVYRRTTTETVTYEDIHRTTVNRQEVVLGYSGRGDRPIPECRLAPIQVFGKSRFESRSGALYMDNKLVVIDSQSSFSEYPAPGWNIKNTLKELVNKNRCKVVQECSITSFGGYTYLLLGDVIISVKEVSPGDFNLLEMRDKGYCG